MRAIKIAIKAYFLIVAAFGLVMWTSYTWAGGWGAPSKIGFFDRMRLAWTMQTIAVVAGGMRVVTWGPALAGWAIYPDNYSFGQWLAPGFYFAVCNKDDQKCLEQGSK
jgi:hypothetical protein